MPKYFTKATASIIGALTGVGVTLMANSRRNQHRISLKKANKPTAVAPVAGQSPSFSTNTSVGGTSGSGYYPKADVLLSAGPRKSQKDTELGEDVAGIALTHNRITFWVLDGTSDSPIISTDKGVEIFSSRVLALMLGATLHQLAPLHPTTDSLLAAAFEMINNQIGEQMLRQRDNLQQFVSTQHSDLHHWQVSTTVLLGILSADGTADLLRIGDSKAFCYDEQGELIETDIANKPDVSGLGRLYARITHEPSNEKNPFIFTLLPPTRSEQTHAVQQTGVRRIIAFSDGIGHPTEQYLQVMLNRQSYSQFQAGLGRTPNRTFDDKTIVLASFEPL